MTPHTAQTQRAELTRSNSTPLAMQQLDPLGTLDGRPISVVTGIGILALASVTSWLHWDTITHPTLAVLALLAVASVSLVLIVGTSSSRAPFTALTHVAAIGLSLIAFALSSASFDSSYGLMTAAWGPVVVGATCMALTPYRPVRELVTAGALASIASGFIGLMRSTDSATPANPMVAALFALTPVLAFSLGGAAFARSLVLSHQRWESVAKHGARRQLEREHASVARSVQQDRVTILNRDVVPLFTELAKRGIVSPDDKERAAAYSSTLRQLIVIEANRSWLELVVASAFGALDDGTRVRDPHRLAQAMTAQQRTALRTAVEAVANGNQIVPSSVRLVIDKTNAGAVIIVRATLSSPESSWRSTLAPYLAVLRVVFTTLQVSHRSSSLTVRFTFDTP
ncbi:hypothetical protein FB472_0959 [Rhodoglobus vestalii]|uniref:Uncharacterized protein n=1 Tax=Rhodoglobus vestalii TaxID=193384 RepID=A0A8H2K9Z5_9MICO|nr:hypothetical protein [Rhodoglobus vestalii]TQO19411.1 hypothetical protein FB472_0959 [Rhodoglobus vestalii]